MDCTGMAPLPGQPQDRSRPATALDTRALEQRLPEQRPARAPALRCCCRCCGVPRRRCCASAAPSVRQASRPAPVPPPAARRPGLLRQPACDRAQSDFRATPALAGEVCHQHQAWGYTSRPHARADPLKCGRSDLPAPGRALPRGAATSARRLRPAAAAAPRRRPPALPSRSCPAPWQNHG